MPHYITKEGLQKLKEELVELKTKETRRITKLIAEAAAFGDLKENSAYHEARHAKSLLLGRIEHLENAINDSVVVEDSGKSSGLQIGNKVEVIIDDEKETYELTAPLEADILKNKISYESPLGKKLIGKKEGEEFEFLMGDKKAKIKIIKIL